MESRFLKPPDFSNQKLFLDKLLCNFTPNFLNRLLFPLEAQETGIPLYVQLIKIRLKVTCCLVQIVMILNSTVSKQFQNTECNPACKLAPLSGSHYICLLLVPGTSSVVKNNY